MFFVTWGYLCPFCLSVFIWEAACWRTMETHLVMGWPHVSDRLSLCLSHSLAGRMAQHGYWITLAYLCCFYSAYIDIYSSFTGRDAHVLPFPFPSSVFWTSLFLCLPLTHTHKYTHINSPLGVCCFHYLQLGPETAFRVEYSRAELARIAVYIERSLVIASSLFSLLCVSGGKYESAVSGDHPCCAAPYLATTVCPPTGQK